MTLPPTHTLYLDDSYCFENQAKILAVQGNELAFDSTCFHPGGGGQPPDSGSIRFKGQAPITISTCHLDEHGIIWHQAFDHLPDLQKGNTGLLQLNIPR